MILSVALVACGTGGDPSFGAEVYAGACVTCHGADGTAMVEVNGVQAPDLSIVVPQLGDDTLLSVLLSGEGEMPVVGLSEAEAADCLAWLREHFAGGE